MAAVAVALVEGGAGRVRRVADGAVRHRQAGAATVDGPVSEIAPTGRLAIAAALPGSRGDALRELDRIGDRHLTHDESGQQPVLAIDRFEGHCEVYRLTRAARLDEALVAARRCGTEEQFVDLLVALGRDDEAAALVNPYSPSDATLAYIAAGRWGDAVMTSGEIEAAASRKDRDVAHCFHELIAGWAGDASAAALLDGEPSAACRLIQRVSRGEAATSARDDDTVSLASQLFGSDYTWLSMQYASPWLAAIDGESSDGQRRQRAMHAMLVGRFDEAGRALASVSTSSDAHVQRDLQVQLALRSNAALPSPRTEHGIWDQTERLRRGIMVHDEMNFMFVSPSTCALAPAVETALVGDGGPLAEVLRTCNVPRIDPEAWLPAVLPHVTRHRAELATVVRSYRSSYPARAPFALVAEQASYGDMSHLIGDDDEARRWQAIIDRHAAMLSDRRRVIALAIWSLL